MHAYHKQDKSTKWYCYTDCTSSIMHGQDKTPMTTHSTSLLHSIPSAETCCNVLHSVPITYYFRSTFCGYTMYRKPLPLNSMSTQHTWTCALSTATGKFLNVLEIRNVGTHGSIVRCDDNMWHSVSQFEL